MTFAVYLPPQAEKTLCPVLYYLSGLTCTEQNVVSKAGAQRYAARHGLILICPDTSPRGEHIADDDAYDLGQGAGFYVNAVEASWRDHFQMYDYVVEELPALVETNFPANSSRSIMGHSMGGHGALIAALRNPKRFSSVSALAPIAAPSQSPWGRKCFQAYLGHDRQTWAPYDAVSLVRAGAVTRTPILIDQGDADEFLESQLRPHLFESACKEMEQPLTLRLQTGYDHSYFFVATFIGDHIAHHAEALSAALH